MMIVKTIRMQLATPAPTTIPRICLRRHIFYQSAVTDCRTLALNEVELVSVVLNEMSVELASILAW